MTLTLRRADARSIGVLIALFERAVGYYATLVGINAYHQPGVEAGKKAAAAVLKVQTEAMKILSAEAQTAAQIAAKMGAADSVETLYWVLEHLAANGRATVTGGLDPDSRWFSRRG
jgi:glucose-6-phosphate isomerase